MIGVTKKQKNRLPKKIVGIERIDKISELAEWYTAASVFVNPTYEDNYPTTNLEALACGTPVITYKTGGSIESAGERYGHVIEQGNIEAVAEYIQKEEWREKTKLIADMDMNVLDAREKDLQYITLYKDILTKGSDKKVEK